MVSNYNKLIPLIFFLGIIFITFASGPPPRQLFLQDGNSIWLGTEQGLHRYQTENELWTTIRPKPVTDICLDEDVLWLGTSDGLSYADLRYLDWKEYKRQHGLPSDSIVRIAADLDYIYAAGSNGLARMDKLVEQWETIGDFSSTRIYDLYSDRDNLWVATDSGIFYFEKQFEKWKQFTVKNGLISNRVFRIFYFNDYVWTLTDKGFSRYNITMKTWNSYSLNSDIPGSAVNYLWLDADYIWIVTPEGIARYNGKNQTWENFSRNTPLENLTVHALSTSGKTFWFAASDGVYSYQEEQRRWRTYTAIEGLSDDEQENIFCVGQTVISKKDNIFCMYYPGEDLWHASKVSGGIDKKAKTGKWDFYDDERGLGFGTPGGQSASLLGRAYFKLKNKADFPAPIDESIKDYIYNKNLDSLIYDTLQSSTGEDSIVIQRIPRFNDYLYWWPKAQLNLNVDLNKGRTLRSSFDNTDPLGNLDYGVEYRGYGEDHIRRAGWLKDQKTDYFFSTLIDPTYLEGAGVRAEFGSRVGEKKRRRVNTGVWAGWRKTEYLKKLIPFQEDNFYYLNVNNIITESVEIRVDGMLVDPREYSIERTMGLLTFKNEGFVNPDSRIEISLEYEPELGGHTNEMAAAENVVVFNDNFSIGANGVYRGIEEPDRPGTGLDTNRLLAGSVNGKVELKSSSGKMTFKAIPEVSTSYNDSILYIKQGRAAKLNANATAYNLRMKGQAQIFSSEYETQADIFSIYGRMNHQGEAEATFDITPFMPVTAGFSLIDASAGEENMQYLEYLLSPAGKPSLKLKGLRQNISCLTQNDPRNQLDSIKTERWNGHIETEWDFPDKALSILHLNRLWLNTSYSLNFITDSLFDSLSTGTPADTLLTTDYLEHLNHNLFGWLQLSPHKNITLETKQIFRFFQQRNNANRPWKEKGNRFRPEFTLFSQELIPGITLYGKYGIEKSKNIFNPDTSDTTGRMLKNRLNSSILLIPGVWWSPMNPFQLNLTYNLLTEDSTLLYDSMVIDTNAIDTSIVDTKTKITKNIGHTYSINPLLDFGMNVHLSNRTVFSIQKSFDELTQEGIKIFNDIELFLRERKTKLIFEYDIANETDYLRDSLADTTVTKLRHEFRFRWKERWIPNFRTELPFNIAWQKIDSVLIDTALSHDYKNSISPGILIDWRIQKKFVREFRIQYFIGATLYDGTFFVFDEYKKSWDNKLDISMKAGRNFFLRMLLNVSYLFDEEILRYDLAEFKATALF